eukprot:6811982-Pyramimonas_sp.AAC.1
MPLPPCEAKGHHLKDLACARTVNGGGASVESKTTHYTVRSACAKEAWGQQGRPRRARNNALREQLHALGGSHRWGTGGPQSPLS